MYKTLLVAAFLALAAPVLGAKSALDLMIEGRFREAKAILDASNASPRYQLLYYGLTEADAVRACSLYQVVAIRYPETDCDSVARRRIEQARAVGLVVVPIAEWGQVSAAVEPLGAIASPEPIASLEAIPEPAPAMEVVPVPVAETVQASPEPAQSESALPAAEPQPSPGAEAEAPASPPEPEVSSAVAAAPVAPTVASPPAEAAPERQMIASARSEESPQVAVELVASPPAPAEPAAPAPPPAPAAEVRMEAADTTSARIQPLPEKLAPHDRPVTNGHWFIQVGAFGNFDNAHRLALSLQNAGFPVKLVPREARSGKLLQVRVGGYHTREECDPVAEQIKNRFHVPAVVISE